MFLLFGFVHFILIFVELYVFIFCCFFVLYVESAPKPLKKFVEIQFCSTLGIFFMVVVFYSVLCEIR